MEVWLERLIYSLISVVIPLAMILANSLLSFGGILLTIILAVWIGVSLVILSPFLT